MCLFPSPNYRVNEEAYKKGITAFPCGACPECLKKKASRWALRAHYEAQEHGNNVSVCLTYDSYMRDSRGNIIGERVSDLSVNKRDVQLFIKRVRKKYGKNVKYIASAEYGKRTHRPHYHVILFGVSFEDCVPYKRSKRGNLIYKSNTLNALWKQGICTVDALYVNSAVARYCTKYAVKDSRADDTFMLCSQGIGINGLLRDFNGKSYIVEGREYPIPREVWYEYIGKKYHFDVLPFTFKYRGAREYGFDIAYRNLCLRSKAFSLRDNDPVYKSYLAYWSEKALLFRSVQRDPLTRINLLPDDKYHSYKIAARKALAARLAGVPVTPPRSGLISAINRYRWENFRIPPVQSFALLSSCHKSANDTFFSSKEEFLFAVTYGRDALKAFYRPSPPLNPLLLPRGRRKLKKK